jgi:hypothetical protein
VPGRADAQIERRSAPLKAALEQVRLDGAICFRTELTEGWALGQVARNTRRDFMSHLLVYVLVNSFIVLIWAITNSGGFFWPIFPMVGWGIGVVMNAWDVWHPAEFDEDQIRREVARIRQKQ